jgi:hypothetical protein
VIRKLFWTGNTLAVSVPQVSAAALGVAEGDYVLVEHDAAAGALLVWPLAARERLGVGSAYVGAVAAFVQDYGEALAALEAE